jgi:hypothetical protein
MRLPLIGRSMLCPFVITMIASVGIVAAPSFDRVVAAAAPVPTGGYDVAFQANTGALWTVGGSNFVVGNQRMMAGTSPGITALPTGGDETAFQSSTGTLWTAGALDTTSWQAGMMPGTSPSIAALANGGYEVAFQANTTALWTVGSAGIRNWGLGMLPGTSPHIVGLANGGYEVAFQANTTALWTAGSAGVLDWRLGMLRGTSPSIDSLPNGGYQVAFQANTTALWTVGSAGDLDWGLLMQPGTSPSIACLPGGGFEVAYQAKNTALVTVGAAGDTVWPVGMMRGTSPSITAAPGGYETAEEVNTTALWTVGTAGDKNWQLGMMAGTSPSITGGTSTPQTASPVTRNSSGVYGSASTPRTAMAGGWAGIGSVSGFCTQPSSSYACPTGADPLIESSLVQSGGGLFWLSFWTIGAPVNGNSWYTDGYTAGVTAAQELTQLGGPYMPTYEILDPEGFGGAPATGPDWSNFLTGWANGLRAVSGAMHPAFYTSQSPIQQFGLLSLPLPAFPAVSPILGNSPFIGGPSVNGYIAYYAACPAAAYVNQVVGWGAADNTVQFPDSGIDCVI